MLQASDNVFDNLPSLAALAPSEMLDEIASFLAADLENPDNVLLW
jgi:hypothetical protein